MAISCDDDYFEPCVGSRSHWSMEYVYKVGQVNKLTSSKSMATKNQMMAVGFQMGLSIAGSEGNLKPRINLLVGDVFLGNRLVFWSCKADPISMASSIFSTGCPLTIQGSKGTLSGRKLSSNSLVTSLGRPTV